MRLKTFIVVVRCLVFVVYSNPSNNSSFILDFQWNVCVTSARHWLLRRLPVGIVFECGSPSLFFLWSSKYTFLLAYDRTFALVIVCDCGFPLAPLKYSRFEKDIWISFVTNIRQHCFQLCQRRISWGLTMYFGKGRNITVFNGQLCLNCEQFHFEFVKFCLLRNSVKIDHQANLKRVKHSRAAERVISFFL